MGVPLPPPAGARALRSLPRSYGGRDQLALRDQLTLSLFDDTALLGLTADEGKPLQLGLAG